MRVNDGHDDPHSGGQSGEKKQDAGVWLSIAAG